MIDKTRPTSREEDYRDYEERDLDEGWPYADAVPGSQTKVGNRSYGEAGENFDEAGNPGFQTSGDTVIKSANGPDLLGDDADADTNDDGIEQMLDDVFAEAGIDTSSFELKVRRGIATVTGEVDTAADRDRIEATLNSAPGIVAVRNRLTLSGADANMPEDWND